MKTYDFPYTGSGGKGDGWAGSVSVDLTDEQAYRLDKSIESGKYDDFEYDDSLGDIREIVWKACVIDTVNNYLICDPEYLNEFGDGDSSPEECAEQLLDSNGATIHYPGTNWW